MKETTLYSIKYILFFVLIPFCIGYGIGSIVKNEREKKETKEIHITVDKYYREYTNLGHELNSKTVKLDTVVTANRRQVDSEIADYLLKTYALYETAYNFAREKELLTRDIKAYQKVMSLMNAIYQSQMEAYGCVYNIFSVGMASSIFVIESEQCAAMANDLTKVTCIDVLKIDPTNQQARETLNKLE